MQLYPQDSTFISNYTYGRMGAQEKKVKQKRCDGRIKFKCFKVLVPNVEWNLVHDYLGRCVAAYPYEGRLASLHPLSPSERSKIAYCCFCFCFVLFFKAVCYSKI